MATTDDAWRAETPTVLAALLRRSDDVGACEDAVQEALLAASRQWPDDGVPDDPRAWLVRVASRKLIDHQRRDAARLARERRVDRERRVVDDAPSTAGRLDDTLHVLVLCAHPALTAPSQVALMLRAVCGLSTSQIAAGFHVPEATMARRLSRARSTIDERDRAVPPPSAADLVTRISAVRHALALMFNEGYTASGGPQLVDADLAAEAIRITRHLQAALPHDAETMGLLALMLLSHSRAAARVDGRGELVPLPDQERQRWDRELIAEGVELVERALPAGPVGPFQLQAAIAAVHAEAATAAATDWAQIVELYRLLDRRAPSPVVTLNMAVAVGMAEGASSGLSLLAPLLDDPAQRHNHRLAAAQAHLLELAGDTAAAREAFARAASMTTSIPEQRYLNRRAAS